MREPLTTEIGDDEPVPLDLAVKLWFAHAGITRHTLLAEIARGRLEYEQTGRKKLVTRRQVQEMRKRCRVHARVQDSGSESVQAENPSMSSSTERMKKAQDSALTVSQRLKSASRNTSQPKAQEPGDKILPLRSP